MERLALWICHMVLRNFDQLLSSPTTGKSTQREKKDNQALGQRATEWKRLLIRNTRTILTNQLRPNDEAEDGHQDRRTNRSRRQSCGGALDEMLLIIKISRTSSSMLSWKNKTF